MSSESIRSTVLSAIKSWQTDNGIEVRGDAVSDIARQFEAEENRFLIRDFNDQFRVQMPDRSTFLNMLVRCYLYSVRDLSLRRSGEPLSVVQLAERFQTAPEPVIITSAQVHQIVLNIFLRAWYGLNLKTATIEVTSRPDHSRPISVDDKSPKGASTNAECSLPPPQTYKIAVVGDPVWSVPVKVNCPGPHGTISCLDPGHPCEVRLTERCEERVHSVVKYDLDSAR